MQKHRSEFDNIGFFIEEVHQMGSKDQNGDHQDDSGGAGNEKRRGNTLSRSCHVSLAQILTHKRGACKRDRLHRQQYQLVDL